MRVTLKHGVPHWCTYWCTLIFLYLDKFLKHFNVIFIYSVVKAMKPGWNIVKKTWQESASFLRYWDLKYIPEKPNSYITIYVPKLRVPCCTPYRGRTFPHSCALLRSLVFAKNSFYAKLNNFLQPRILRLT